MIIAVQIKDQRIMKILIVDDHPVIIAGCNAMFSAEGDISLISAQDARAGFDAFCREAPDLCILDISLPDESGFDLMQRIIKNDENAKIIIFSMNDDPIFALRALRLGAKAYVTKNDNPYLLIEAIRSVISEKTFLMPRIAEALSAQGTSAKIDIWTNLNEREQEILKLLGGGQHPREIADTLSVSYKTVVNGCTIIKNKLGLRTISELSQKAYEYKNMI